MSVSRSVVVDIDGVVADFVLGFTKLARAVTANPSIKMILSYLHQQWNFKDVMSSKEADATWRYIYDHPWWWSTLNPLIRLDMCERLNTLSRKVPIYFVTHRPDDAHVPTATWLSSMLHISHPSVIMSKYKGEVARLLGATHAIDDKIENCWVTHWIADKPQIKSYVLDRPYNRKAGGPTDIIRVEQFSQFMDDVEKYYE